MNDTDLDKSYTALCEAISRVGEQRAPLFLGMLAMSLISRLDRADEVLPLISRLEEQTEL